MGKDDSLGDAVTAVQSVLAWVELEPESIRQSFLEPIRASEVKLERESSQRLADDPLSDEMLHLYVSLSAELRDGRQIRSAGRDFGISLQRRGIGAIWRRCRGPTVASDPYEQTDILARSYRVSRYDIEDAINQMLGRDPEQHRPPRLAWGALIAALADAGVCLGEEDLIAAPMTVQFDREVEAAIDDGQSPS